MAVKEDLVHTDSAGDCVRINTSNITGITYIAVNGGEQVRIRESELEPFQKFFSKEKEETVKPDAGQYLLLRQKKSKPEKIKVCFAGTASGQRIWTSLQAAQQAASNLNDVYTKWNYFVVEKEAV